jgi:hypothetical protein
MISVVIDSQESKWWLKILVKGGIFGAALIFQPISMVKHV